MVVLLAVLLLFLGAVALLFLSPERRSLRAVVFLAPILSLIILLLPIPLPDSFSIVWQPASLFPDPLNFRSNPTSVSFAVFFCILLILIEWTAPMRRVSPTPSRLLCFLLTIAGILALCASNAMAVALVWGWIDFISFFAVLLLSRSADVGPKGITSSVARSIGILSMNFLGNALILFPVLVNLPVTHSDWNTAWNQPNADWILILFLLGIAIRILVIPMQFSFSRLITSSTGVDALLRIISPSIVLSLLSRVWPGQLLATGGNALRMLPVVFFALMFFWAGFQWWMSTSAYRRRDLYLLGVPCMAILAALQNPNSPEVFRAAGTLVILGGGTLLLYRGYLAHQRWMAVPPLILAFLQTGILLSPASVLFSAIFFETSSVGNFGFLVFIGFGWILLIGALLRLSFEPVEEFSMGEPIPLAFYFLGMVLALVFMFYPGWPIPQPLDLRQILIPFLFLAFASLSVMVIGRYRRSVEDVFLFLENIFRLDWFQTTLSFISEKTLSLAAGIEDFISGEGVMLWILGFSLFLILVLRGG